MAASYRMVGKWVTQYFFIPTAVVVVGGEQSIWGRSVGPPPGEPSPHCTNLHLVRKFQGIAMNGLKLVFTHLVRRPGGCSRVDELHGSEYIPWEGGGAGGGHTRVMSVELFFFSFFVPACLPSCMHDHPVPPLPGKKARERDDSQGCCAEKVPGMRLGRGWTPEPDPCRHGSGPEQRIRGWEGGPMPFGGCCHGGRAGSTFRQERQGIHVHTHHPLLVPHALVRNRSACVYRHTGQGRLVQLCPPRVGVVVVLQLVAFQLPDHPSQLRVGWEQARSVERGGTWPSWCASATSVYRGTT